MKTAKQCASDKPSWVNATVLSVINKALSQTQMRVRERKLFGDIACRLFKVKERVIVLAKINVDGKGFVLLGVRLKGASITCSPLAFDPILHQVPSALLQSSDSFCILFIVVLPQLL